MGLMMGRSSPFSSAMVRNVRVTASRFGRPKEMLETPRTVFSPSSVLTRWSASRVSFAPSCSADAVSVRQSMYTSRFGIPSAVARSRMRLAMANRSAAFLGMPFSSRVSPTTAAPYFLTSGRMFCSDASSPLTELTMGLPLYTRSAASMTAGMVESSCKGVPPMDWSAFTVRIIMPFSSMPGIPTFTSKRSAPASTCCTAWSNM